MGGHLIEALRIAASLATLSHSGVAILAASEQLNPAWKNKKPAIIDHSSKILIRPIINIRTHRRERIKRKLILKLKYVLPWLKPE